MLHFANLSLLETFLVFEIRKNLYSLFKKWTTSFLNRDFSVLQKKHNEKKD